MINVATLSDERGTRLLRLDAGEGRADLGVYDGSGTPRTKLSVSLDTCAVIAAMLQQTRELAGLRVSVPALILSLKGHLCVTVGRMATARTTTLTVSGEDASRKPKTVSWQLTEAEADRLQAALLSLANGGITHD